MRLRSSLLAAALLVTTASAQAPLKSGLDLSLVDKSVRPQDDFFRYVNGGWLAKTEIPADRPAYSAGQELADKAEAGVRGIIEEAAAATNTAASPQQQVGDLYKSFMDEAGVNALGAAPIKPVLQRIDAIATTAQLAAEIGTLSATGIGGPIGGGVQPDAKDPSVNAVYLFQGGTALPDRDFYLKNDPQFITVRAKYHEFLTNVFTLAGRQSPAGDAQAVLALETELAKVQWTQVDSRDAVKSYNKYALDALPTAMPGFDWMAWATPQGIDRSPYVIVAQPSFFKSFAAMVPTTPLATWKAWLAAQYITTSVPFLSQPFVDAGFEFFGKVMSGQQAQRPRWKRGVQLVNNNLGESVGRLYVARYFPPAAKTRLQKLIANLIEAYRGSISTLDWMTKPTRQQALDKLSLLTSKVAYPDKWRDYSGLVIKSDDLLGNFERASRHENDRQLAKIGKPVDRSEWLLTPQTVNAYYNPIMNEVVFPAAILQAPYFTFDADDAVNYGGIGAVIGHEIGHGFDDQGRRYDGTGTLRDWWTPADEVEFQKRARMLVEQFNQFSPVDGLHVNGQLTLGENIGDLGGLSIAFKAYQISLGGKPAPVIDGLTGPQRFFMGWGQVWRAKERPEYLRQIILSNPHAPSMYRANNPPSNIQAFYDAFGLKPGDKLYREPKDRVRIW